jgi:hypothetical protein
LAFSVKNLCFQSLPLWEVSFDSSNSNKHLILKLHNFKIMENINTDEELEEALAKFVNQSDNEQGSPKKPSDSNYESADHIIHEGWLSKPDFKRKSQLIKSIAEGRKPSIFSTWRGGMCMCVVCVCCVCVCSTGRMV